MSRSRGAHETCPTETRCVRTIAIASSHVYCVESTVHKACVSSAGLCGAPACVSYFVNSPVFLFSCSIGRTAGQPPPPNSLPFFLLLPPPTKPSIHSSNPSTVEGTSTGSRSRRRKCGESGSPPSPLTHPRPRPFAPHAVLSGVVPVTPRPPTTPEMAGAATTGAATSARCTASVV